MDHPAYAHPCPACTAPNIEAARFCRVCGTRIVRAGWVGKRSATPWIAAAIAGGLLVLACLVVAYLGSLRATAVKAMANAYAEISGAQRAGAGVWLSDEYGRAYRAYEMAKSESAAGKWPAARRSALGAESLAMPLAGRMVVLVSRRLTAVTQLVESARAFVDDGDDVISGDYDRARRALESARGRQTSSDFAGAMRWTTVADTSARRIVRLAAARANPLTMIEAKVRNVGQDGTSYSGFQQRFRRDEIRYISSRFVLANNLYGLEDADVTFAIRISGPQGLVSGWSSPDGYTLESEELVRKDQSQHVFERGWGSPSGGTYQAGSYSVALYANGKYMGSTDFSVGY